MDIYGHKNLTIKFNKNFSDLPPWFRMVKTENAVVSTDYGCGYINWHDGIWRGGEWNKGSWYGGKWMGGTWLGGDWHGGVWVNGTWAKGYWRDGIWVNGAWENGLREKGLWISGQFFGKKCIGFTNNRHGEYGQTPILL